MYLGSQLNLLNGQDVEIKHRMARAWGKFAAFRPELTDQQYPLTSRLKLFDTVVMASALNGSGTWTVTNERERIVRSIQRKMLRAILGRGRHVLKSGEHEEGGDEGLEPWVSWIQRTTHGAERHLKRAGCKD